MISSCFGFMCIMFVFFLFLFCTRDTVFAFYYITEVTVKKRKHIDMNILSEVAIK